MLGLFHSVFRLIEAYSTHLLSLSRHSQRDLVSNIFQMLARCLFFAFHRAGSYIFWKKFSLFSCPALVCLERRCLSYFSNFDVVSKGPIKVDSTVMIASDSDSRSLASIFI